MKLSRKAIIAIVGGVVLLLAVVGVAFAFISNNANGQNASLTPTSAFSSRRETLIAQGFGGGANGTPGAGGFGGGANGTPGAGGFGGRFGGTPTSTQVPGTPTSTPTPPITPTDTSTPTFTPTSTPKLPFTLYYLSSPVKVDAGGVEASAQVLTDPGKNCILTYTSTDGKVLNLGGTGVATADTVGVCEWSWIIPGGTKPGTAQVSITVDQFTLTYPMVVK